MAVCFPRTWRGLVGVLVKCLAEAAVGVYRGTVHLLHMGSLQPGGCENGYLPVSIGNR